MSQEFVIPGSPAIAAWKIGEGQETFIVLHGGPATEHSYLRPEFDKLSKFGTLIYFDQRGCGKTEDAKSYTWSDHIADLLRVIRATGKEKKVVLVASSWGTLLALAFTMQYPNLVKGMILSGTVRWPGISLPENNYNRIRKNLYKPPADTIVRFTLSEPRYSTNTRPRDQSTEIVKRELTSRHGNANYEPFFSFKTAPKFKSLKHVSTPVLIFNGDRDNCYIDWGTRYDKILPNSKLVTIAGACHDPWLNNPIVFFANCEEFLNRIL